MSSEGPENGEQAAGQNPTEATLAAALRPFGWTCTPDFWKRYYADPWVFNLANAVESLTVALDKAQLDSIEARNPGIDMDEVRRIRKASSAASRSVVSPNPAPGGDDG
jgi:hypothetical protein